MSEKDINKEAFKQAEKELFEKKIEEIKGYILKTLEKIEIKKKEKNKIEEEIRILKLDIEDFRNGNLDKIEERLNKSKVAREVSAVNLVSFHSAIPISGTCTNTIFSNNGWNGTQWSTYTAGTYSLSSGKIIYLN